MIETKEINNAIATVIGDKSILIEQVGNQPKLWEKVIWPTETKSITDLTATDWLQDQPETTGRFSLILILSDHKGSETTARVDIDDVSSPTLTSLFPSSNYLEREIFDLFGITFQGHPDLRRILTDYGFIGHPLRKDFPMIGYQEMFYSLTEKGVTQRLVTMNQEFRLLKPTSQWVYKGEASGELDPSSPLAT